MKHLIIILTLCIALPSLSIAASIEQERMQESIKQEQEELQKQREQQVVQPVYIIIRCFILTTPYRSINLNIYYAVFFIKINTF
jgi:uncharacterized membrane protein